MERKDELNLQQIAELKSKLEALEYQKNALQRDLLAVEGQIAVILADIDLLTVEYQPTLQKVAEELSVREVLAEKV